MKTIAFCEARFMKAKLSIFIGLKELNFGKENYIKKDCYNPEKYFKITKFCLTKANLYDIIFSKFNLESDIMQRRIKGLNKREKAILKFIEKQIIEDGYPPSVREIGKAVGLNSTATVHGYLARLREKGYIKKEDKKGRTLRLLKSENGEEFNPSPKNFYAQKELVDVPVVGKITAGMPILAVENVTDTFPIPLDFVGNSESFMLTVRGESMIEAGILDGDYILVRKQNDATNGEIVVALIEDEATVKTFYKETDHIRLQPENSAMDPIIVPNCEILGKVIGVFRKMR